MRNLNADVNRTVLRKLRANVNAAGPGGGAAGQGEGEETAHAAQERKKLQKEL